MRWPWTSICLLAHNFSRTFRRFFTTKSSRQMWNSDAYKSCRDFWGITTSLIRILSRSIATLKMLQDLLDRRALQNWSNSRWVSSKQSINGHFRFTFSAVLCWRARGSGSKAVAPLKSTNYTNTPTTISRARMWRAASWSSSMQLWTFRKFTQSTQSTMAYIRRFSTTSTAWKVWSQNTLTIKCLLIRIVPCQTCRKKLFGSRISAPICLIWSTLIMLLLRKIPQTWLLAR